MTQPTVTLQWRAAIAVAFLIAMGAFLGVAADRVWLSLTSQPAERQQVSIEALAFALNLNSRQTEEIAALVDSLGWTISDALEQHPDSLRAVVRQARQRLERALPSDRQERFRSWAEVQRSAMLDRMRGRGRWRDSLDRRRHLMPDSGSARPRRGGGPRRQGSGGGS